MTPCFTLARSRRRFLGAGVVGTLGFACSSAMRRMLAQEAQARRAKACILLWLNGGPSHLDTFDPKPGAPTGGPFEAIETSVPGIRICQHLPELAKQAKHLAMLRSLKSKEADHGRANYYLHTGNDPQPPVDYPALGAVVAKHWSAEEADLPPFVVMGDVGFENGPGFFGLDFAYAIGDPTAPVANVVLPEGIDAPRTGWLRSSSSTPLSQGASRQPIAASHSHYAEKALRLMNGAGLKAFDLDEEPPRTQAAYGLETDAAGFGRSCLLARRLIERGVKFVEVSLDGWDTHADNFNSVAQLCGQLDAPFAALLADLDQRDLLAETLVVCMGEFGRTPTINGDAGRDHWSEAFSVVLAGGGVRGGQVIGASNKRGERVADRPISPPDLYATLLQSFGIDPAEQYRTSEGRPIKLTDKASPVHELF